MRDRKKDGGLHRLFQAAVLIKGIDGVLETIGGVLLVLVSPDTVHRLIILLTQHELAEEADDWVIMALHHLAERFSVEAKHFASGYLIGHGLLKVFLAVSLFRERVWAFPLALFVLAVFVAYQLHRFGRTHSMVLLALTLLDVVVMALVWREFRARAKSVPASAAQPRDR